MLTLQPPLTSAASTYEPDGPRMECRAFEWVVALTGSQANDGRQQKHTVAPDLVSQPARRQRSGQLFKQEGAGTSGLRPPKVEG